MDRSDINILNLSQGPCITLYLDNIDRFIIGTYELLTSLEDARLKLQDLNADLTDANLEEILKKVNHRIGQLIIVKDADLENPSVECEFNCDIGGGVFDLQVHFDHTTRSYDIYVAHSNGVVGLYQLSIHSQVCKISLLGYMNIVGSEMLTSIDILSSQESEYQVESLPKTEGSTTGPMLNSTSCLSELTPNSYKKASLDIARLVVSDSTGSIIFVDQGRQSRIDTKSRDPVWQVRSLRLQSNHNLVLVGVENSSWYICGYGSTAESVFLYENEASDFGAGVTSISVLNTYSDDTHDLFDVSIGSYDGTIHLYEIKVTREANLRVDVCHRRSIMIDQAGIWRVKSFRDQKDPERQRLFIAAMYRGCYIVSLSSSSIENEQLGRKLVFEDDLNLLIDIDSLGMSKKPLHYDIGVSSSGRTCCIVDFNNRLCLIKKV